MSPLTQEINLWSFFALISAVLQEGQCRHTSIQPHRIPAVIHQIGPTILESLRNNRYRWNTDCSNIGNLVSLISPKSNAYWLFEYWTRNTTNIMVRKPCCVCAITCQIWTKSAQPFRRHCEIIEKVTNTDYSTILHVTSPISWWYNRAEPAQLPANFQRNRSSRSGDIAK